ncbi:MAG: hypothetical protein H6712_33065 [Myxococcales bacterium]|nr:hypothetical protein [Myxococcales bacterium]MCB9718724.1 hypothetical protein [Myxococcales bacterium]
MVRRKLGTMILAAGLGVGVGVLAPAGCQPEDSGQFNAELADLVCEINSRCPHIDLRADWGSIPFTDETCHGDVEDHFSMCQGTCEFKRSAARQCLRRLERVAEDCETPLSLGPCRRAYHDCNTSTDETACSIHNCGARLGSPPSDGAALGLLALLGLLGRRRRRGG